MAKRELEPIFLLLLLLPTLSKTLLAHLEGMELSKTGLFPKGVRIQEFFFAWINYLICQHLFKNIQWMSTMMCSSAVLKGWVYIRGNVDEFGEEDVTGKCCSFSVACLSELLLSQKQADRVEGGNWIGASRVLRAVGKHGWQQLIMQNTKEGSLNVST